MITIYPVEESTKRQSQPDGQEILSCDRTSGKPDDLHRALDTSSDGGRPPSRRRKTKFSLRFRLQHSVIQLRWKDGYMNGRLPSVLSSSVAILLTTNICSAATPSTPSRGDAIAAGDRIILNADAPIFRLDRHAGGDPTTRVCAPRRTQLVIESAPSTTTTTETKSSGGDGSPPIKTTTGDAKTTVETTAASAGDKTTTTVATATTATALIVRVGPYFHIPFTKPSTSDQTCVEQVKDQLKGVETVKVGTTYEFTPSDLAGYGAQRYGLTYGVVIVPNKVMIADRTFISSSSVLPYVGYQAWGPSWAGAVVLAAGVGTVPASTQASPASSGTSNSTGTKATFSVATGIVGSIGSTFKVGLLVGVDTEGSKTGFKYQGKPWIGVSLGAGSQ
jgi:hypothetical protein